MGTRLLSIALDLFPPAFITSSRHPSSLLLWRRGTWLRRGRMPFICLQVWGGLTWARWRILRLRLALTFGLAFWLLIKRRAGHLR